MGLRFCSTYSGKTVLCTCLSPPVNTPDAQDCLSLGLSPWDRLLMRTNGCTGNAFPPWATIAQWAVSWQQHRTPPSQAPQLTVPLGWAFWAAQPSYFSLETRGWLWKPFRTWNTPSPHMKLHPKVSFTLKNPPPLGRFQTTLPSSHSSQSTDGLQDVLGTYPGTTLSHSLCFLLWLLSSWIISL